MPAERRASCKEEEMQNGQKESKYLHQEREYVNPYHYLIRETGGGIPYISMLRLLRGIVDPRPGESLLDAGCGDGRILLEFSGSGCRLFGVDTSLKALGYASGFVPGANFSVQNINSLAFPDGCFQKIMLIETLEHIPPGTSGAALGELSRVLAPGGRLVISVPTPRLPLPPKHYRHFTPRELENIAGEHFTVEAVIGHDRSCALYRLLVALGDNKIWHLRAGFNRLLRWYFGRFLKSSPPDKARRLLAVCSKK